MKTLGWLAVLFLLALILLDKEGRPWKSRPEAADADEHQVPLKSGETPAPRHAATAEKPLPQSVLRFARYSKLPLERVSSDFYKSLESMPRYWFDVEIKECLADKRLLVETIDGGSNGKMAPRGEYAVLGYPGEEAASVGERIHFLGCIIGTYHEETLTVTSRRVYEVVYVDREIPLLPLIPVKINGR